MYIVHVSTNTITSAHLRAPHHLLHRNAYYCMCSAHIVHCSVLSITHCTHYCSCTALHCIAQCNCLSICLSKEYKKTDEQACVAIKACLYALQHHTLNCNSWLFLSNFTQHSCCHSGRYTAYSILSIEDFYKRNISNIIDLDGFLLVSLLLMSLQFPSD